MLRETPENVRDIVDRHLVEAVAHEEVESHLAELGADCGMGNVARVDPVIPACTLATLART